MKYEKIKTFLLTLLMTTSIFLSWALWTYQPQYDTYENANEIVEEVSIGNKEDIHSLIKPSQIIYHYIDLHTTTYNETDIQEIMNEMKTWELRDFNNITSTVTKEEYSAFLQTPGHVEVLFPDEVPLNIFKYLFQIEESNLPTNSFDRVIINVNEQEEEGVIYFVSNRYQIIYEAQVKRELISSFEKGSYEQSRNLTRCFPYQITDVNTIFLPEEQVQLEKAQYYTDLIDPEAFKEALFLDTSIVKKDILPYAEVYTDGSKLLRVYLNGKVIEFVNQVNNEEKIGSGADLLKSSIDFVNDHGGWTDSYRYFSKSDKETVFRLYINNYPVFSTNGLSEINQTWGKNDIIEYQRPLVVLELKLDPFNYMLPSAREITKIIENTPGFQADLLTNITIAYEMVEDKQISKIMTLEPIWCYYYDGRWIKVNLNETDTLGGQ